MTASGERLIAEALAKSGIIWLTSRSGTGPVWYVALNDVAYVVTGPGEQACPIHEGTTTVVARSKETRARLLSYEADANVLTPESEDWDAAVAALIAGRLNAPAGDVEARWRENNTILRFTPDTASVIVRGEHVTSHERQVDTANSSETSAVTESEAPSTPPLSDVDSTEPTPTSSQAAHSESMPGAAARPTGPVGAGAQAAASARNAQQTATPAVTPPTPTTESREESQQKSAVLSPSTRAAETQPIPVRPRKTPEQAAPETATVRPTKPAAETTQPIPVRSRRRNTEQTQPIPVRAPSRPPHEPGTREITEPIPVRPRNREAAPTAQVDDGNVIAPGDVAKVDQ